MNIKVIIDKTVLFLSGIKRRYFIIPLIVVASATVIYLLLFNLLPGIQESSSKKYLRHHKLTFELSTDLQLFEKETKRLEKKLATATTSRSYMVINTTSNHYWLYGKNTLIREGEVSTGSYIQLVLNEDKNWIFRTPRGIFTIKGKITDPVWRKPDWAFVEEGLPVPSANDPSRYEYGVLGDYALSLGDGYLIHGTLYQRLLGMPVTHGCIRMRDEDLEVVFKNLQVGSKVLIY